MTLINRYNEFTLHSYTNESTKLTERQQLDQVRKLIENTIHIVKWIYWIDDVYIDLINSPLANSFINFCDSNGIKIENWNATRDKARLDHILNLRASVHSIQIRESYVSDHNMIVFKLGKKHPQKPFFQSQQFIRPRTGVLELLINVFYSDGAGYSWSDQ